MSPSRDNSIVINYSLPQNFDSKDSTQDVFKKISPEILPAPKIKFLKNFRISQNSIAFNYFNIIKETCIGEDDQIYKKYQKGFGFFLKYIFPKFNFSKKRLLLITDEWTTNYYHWHIFALKKLVILKEAGLLKDSLLFLPRRYLTCSFALTSLEKFGVKKEQIIFLRKRSNIKAREIAFVKAPHRVPSAIISMRKILLKNVQKISGHKRIFISRQKQKLRFIENENEVMQLLAHYGFEKIYMEDLSYEQQISICANAKYIVGPHGAGLANLLFAREDASVLELSGAPDIWKPVTDFYRLSNILNLKYFYQECEFGENSQVKDFHHGSLVVDLVRLEQNLKLMLKDEPEFFTKPPAA